MRRAMTRDPLAQPPGLLPGSLRNHGPLRACGRCERTVVPEGGVQLNPARWVCGACWIKRPAGNRP